MLVHPQKMVEIAHDSRFSYWKCPDGNVYRAHVNPREKWAPGIICNIKSWEKIKHKILGK